MSDSGWPEDSYGQGDYHHADVADHLNPPPGLQSTPKIPPGFDGRGSWFAYEEAIDDWLDITTLQDEKLGPSLKNRLTGDAAIYKPYLDRERLRDPLGGVNYFKDTIRPHLSRVPQVCFCGGSFI